MSETAHEGGVEIYATSGFPVGQKEAVVSSVRQTLQEKPNERYQKLGLEIDLEKDGSYKDALVSIKNDLNKQYLSAGIVFAGGRFPDSHDVHIIDPSRIKRAGTNIPSGSSSAIDGRVEVWPVGGEMFLLDIAVLHHEIDHVVGRRFMAVGPAKEEGSSIICHMGFDVALGKDLVAKRGQVLEEGVVEYFAREYVLSSDDPFVVEARRKYIKSVGVESDGLDDLEIRKICKNGLETSSGVKYNNSKEIVETLIEGARRIGEDEALAMKTDLLRARVETKNMRSLMDRVDRIFGEGTFSKVYHMKFIDNDEENRRFVDELREKVGLE